MAYDVTMGRTDLRWLDAQGDQLVERTKGSYLFRSAVTDEAQQLVERNGFDGTYVRHLSTGHCETEQISLAMLSLAEKQGGIVGVTLEGLAKDNIASRLVEYPAGRVLYEVLVESPSAFKVSADEGVQMPDFTGFPGVDVYVGGLGNMKYLPNRKQKGPNKQAENIMGNVYIELRPEFVAKLGSANREHGPLYIREWREFVEGLKGEPSELPKSRAQKIAGAVGIHL